MLQHEYLLSGMRFCGDIPVIRKDGARSERKDDARAVKRFTTKDTKDTKQTQRKQWLSVLAS